MLNQISLLEVLKKYLGYSSSDFVEEGPGIYKARCVLHHERSGSSLAIYHKPTGWDWCCFGACGTGGTAIHLLLRGQVADTAEQAEEMLRKDFGLVLPEFVTLAEFAKYKGLDAEFLKSRGIVDAVHMGEHPALDIPYIDEKGAVISVKRRLRFKGKQKFTFVSGNNALYGLDTLNSYATDTLFIAEGESDTLTLMQVGLPALGVPGANSWQPHWVDKLRPFVRKVLVPDPDTAGMKMVGKMSGVLSDNLYVLQLPPQYKDVSDYYKYGCGADKQVFLTNFNKLPQVPATKTTLISHFINNKSDITRPEMWRLVISPMNPAEQLALLDEVAVETKTGKRILSALFKELRAKAAKQDSYSDVYIEEGKYFKEVVAADGFPRKKQLTDFTMSIQYIIAHPDGTQERVVRVTNNNGQEATGIKFDGESLTAANKFSATCMAYGPYHYNGGQECLNDLTAHVFSQSPEYIVHATPYIGHVGNKWILGDVGIDEQGVLFERNPQNFIEFLDKKFLVKSINMVEGDDVPLGFPKFPEPPELRDLALVRKELAETIKRSVGGFHAWLGLGWSVANWYSDAIYKHRRDMSYPLFFIRGKRASGKTYLARWIMALGGFPDSEGSSFTTPSVVSITRKLGYYASLPLWYDDFKGEIKDLQQRTNLLIGAYNRQGAAKGTRTGTGVRMEALRGTILLSGEDTPKDSALLSRLVLVQTSQYSRDDAHLPKMQELAEHLPSLGLHFCKESQKNGATAILAKVDELQKWLISQGIDGRLAKNYATCLAGFEIGFGDTVSQEEMAAFKAWVLQHVMLDKLDVEETHITHQFFSDLVSLISDRELERDKHFKLTGGALYLWLPMVHDKWTVHLHHRRRDPVSRQTLKSYLQKEPFYQGEHRLRFEGSGSQRCIKVSLKLVEHDELVGLCDELIASEEY